MKHKKIIIEQYNALSSFLLNLCEKDITDLESGKTEIKFELSEKNTTVESKAFSLDDAVLQSIIEELNNSISREEGLDLLKKKCSSKLDFESIAKKIDVPFTKKDTIEKLKDKIIEGTIGFRLRSKAIQDKEDTIQG